MAGQDEVALITADQEVTAADFMAMQQSPQQTQDADVAEALGITDAYTGLVVTKATDTDISIAAGRYYKSTVSGLTPRFRLADAQVLSLLQYVPQLGNKRIVSVCAVGQENNTANDIRRFLVDATPGAEQYEPRTVSTRLRREISLQLVAGPQGTAPVNPAIPGGYLEIARVTLSEIGIVGTPRMQTVKSLRSLTATQAALDAQQDQLESFSSDLDSLRSDLAALAARLDKKPDDSEFIALSRAVAIIGEKFDFPDTGLAAGSDTFDSDSESDIAAAGYDAFIDVGALRFPREAVSNQAIALLNPVDPRLKISNNEQALPVFDEVVWFGPKTMSSTATVRPLDNAQNPTWHFARDQVGRKFFYFGGGQNLRAMERTINDRGSVKLFDPQTNAYETIDLSAQRWLLRMDYYAKGFAKIQVVDPYPDDDARKVVTTVAGAAIAQGLIAPGNRWVTGFDLAVTEKGADSPIYVALCRAKPDGAPDLNRCLQVATVAYADIKTWPDVTAANFSVPVLLDRGQRYAIAVATAGAHVLGVADSGNPFAGMLYAATDGSQFSAVPDKILGLSVRAAKFRATRTIVEIESLQLAGGLANFDAFFYGREPSASELVLQGQIGGVWRSLNHTDLTALATVPALLPLRLVFLGSETLQPSIHLSAARLVGWRQKTALTHISTARQPAAASQDITVEAVLLDYDAAKHTVAISLLPGPGYNVPSAANSATVYSLASDPRRKRLVAKFTPGAPGLNDFKIKIAATATIANDAFAIDRRIDIER